MKARNKHKTPNGFSGAKILPRTVYYLTIEQTLRARAHPFSPFSTTVLGLAEKEEPERFAEGSDKQLEMVTPAAKSALSGRGLAV